MKKLFFFILFFAIYITGYSQIPESASSSTASIAEYVKEHFKNDRDKFLAIYKWVTSNITYSTDSINIINLGPDPDAKVNAAFRRKKGVCENFSVIFHEICSKAGLTSFVVDGYTKQGTFVDRVGHTWDAVMLEGTWMLCDPTWDSNSGNTFKYFLADPSELIHTHMPFDPMWQLIDHPLTNREFYDDHAYGKNYFNYTDSISRYLKLDSLQQLRSVASRIEKNGIENELVKNRLNYVRMYIEMILQDNDVDLYNSSVASLNTVTSQYNSFVQYRNNLFSPLKSDDEIRTLLSGTDDIINVALKKLNKIDRTEAMFTFSTDGIRDKLYKISEKIKAQKDFLENYLKTAKANRSSLFYTRQLTSAGK